MDTMLGRKETEHPRERDASLVPDHLTRAEDALAKLVQEAAQAEIDSRFAAERDDASLEPRIAASELDVAPHPIGNEPPTERPPRRRRFRRAVVRFLFAVAIGVAGTLAWQSYGQAARQMLAVYVPALAPSSSGMMAVMPATETERAEAAAVPTPPAASEAEPAAPFAAISPEVLQRITQMAYDLAAMRKSMDQLSATQDQMSRTMARLQTSDEEIKAKLAAAPPAPAVAAVAPVPAVAQAPAHKPPAAKPARPPQVLAPGPRPLSQSFGPSPPPPPRATAP